jgi:hypothetical protein
MFLAGIEWCGKELVHRSINYRSAAISSKLFGLENRNEGISVHPVLSEEPLGGMDELGVDEMKPLANWKVVIGCPEAFKNFFRVKRFGMPGLCPRC